MPFTPATQDPTRPSAVGQSGNLQIIQRIVDALMELRAAGLLITGDSSGGGSGSVSSSNITDATTVGRNVLTAADAAAARSAIGAGTSSLALGTTSATAKAGNYVPAWSEVTSKPSTFTPSTHTHSAADIASGVVSPARLGSGTTDGTTVLYSDGTWRVPPSGGGGGGGNVTSSQITDATTVGRNVLTATDAAAARSAIGAGTSSLALGTTSTTAKAGDYVPAWSEVTSKPSTFTPSTHTHSSTAIDDFTEAVQDVVGAMARSGTNATVSYDDSAGTLTFSASGSGTTGVIRTPEQFGAQADGTTDDTAAINQALRAGTAGDTVRFTSGKTYAHSGVLGGGTTPVTAGITIDGLGAVLLSTDPANASFWIQANDVTVRNLTLRSANLAGRLSGWEKYHFLAKDCTRFRAHNVQVLGGAAAGVFMHNVDGFLLERMTVRDTLADGVHISSGSRNGLVMSPVVDNVGDDGVAIVSYVADTDAVRNVHVVSPRVLGQTNGRGVTIVGGDNIWYYDIFVRRSYGGGIYIANEQGQDFQTRPVTNSGVLGGRIEEANYASSLDHAGIFLLNQQASTPLSDVLIRDITVEDMARSGQPAINVKNSGSNGQFLRTALRNIRLKGRMNWQYPMTFDSGITQNPSPYATANGVTVEDVTWVADQDRVRKNTISAATTLPYDVEAGTWFCSGGGYQVNLPTAGTPALDSTMVRRITLVNTGTSAITVAGGGNVNGASTWSLAAKTGATFINDGSGWWSI